jgi:hypothetical protein
MSTQHIATSSLLAPATVAFYLPLRLTSLRAFLCLRACAYACFQFPNPNKPVQKHLKELADNPHIKKLK